MTFPLLLAGAMAIAPALVTEKSDTTAQQMDEVVVTGSRMTVDQRLLPQTLNTVSRDQLTQVQRQSVLPTLCEEVPGLMITSRGILGYGVSTGAAGTMKVRGIGGMGALLVLVDGLPQYAGLYGHPIADMYTTSLAEKVEVVRGPASTIYGSNAMGGVVNIFTRKHLENGQHTNINLQGGSYGTLQATASNTWRRNKWFGAVGTNYAHTNGHRDNTEFEQGAGFFKVGYDFNQHWSAVANADITYFESQNPGTLSDPVIDNNMYVFRGLASASITNKYRHANGAIRGFHNWGHHHINDGYSANGGTPRTSHYLHDDRQSGLSAYETLNLWHGNHLTLGIDYSRYGGHAWSLNHTTGDKSDYVDKVQDEVAGYVDFQQSITRWMSIDAAIRYTHHSHLGNEWTPRGGLSFQLPRHLTLKASVGQGYRNPTMREMYMYTPANDELDPERMMNYEIGLEQNLMEGRLRWKLNVFYLKADNLIASVMNTELNHRQWVNTGATEHHGVEAEMAWRVNSHLRLNANYSYLYMSKVQESAPKHKAYAGVDWRYGRWQLDGGLQYLGKLALSQGDSSYTSDTESVPLLHASVKYHAARYVDVFVTGDNLLGQKYHLVKGYRMPKATFMAGFDVNF